MPTTRREFLAAGAAFAAATGMSLRDAYAQKGFRLGGRSVAGGGGPDPDPGAPDLTKAVVTANDLVYRGCYRFAASEFGLAGATEYYGFAMKSDGRFFMRDKASSSYHLLECALPDAEPAVDINAAPFITLWHNWGDVMSGHIRATRSNGLDGMRPRGLLYDDDKQTLWWNYQDAYTQSNCPSLSCTTLNYTAMTSVTRGPWRASVTTKRARSALWAIPPAWATTYFDGYGIACGSGSVSGADHSQGPALTPLDLLNFDFESVPSMALDCLCADTSDWQVSGKPVLWYPSPYQLPTDAIYKHCGPVNTAPYNCDAGSNLYAGEQIWGTADLAQSENDTISSGVWVDLPDKHGVLFFGQMVTTPAGYTAPGDADGIVHRGYSGIPNTVGGLPACCHGQTDQGWLSTGPWAHVKEKFCWHLDPVKLIPLAASTEESYSIRTMDDRWALRSKVPGFGYTGYSNGYGFSNGAHFDAATRRVYVLFQGYDLVTVSGARRPVVFVFEVA